MGAAAAEAEEAGAAEAEAEAEVGAAPAEGRGKRDSKAWMLSTTVSSVSTAPSGAPPARMSDASYASDLASGGANWESFRGRKWSLLDDEYAKSAAASPEMSQADKAALLGRIASTKQRIEARVTRVMKMVEALA